ncbi:uncharacterized protein LOC62_06G008762 [Vanrija pseudolonga]|uniref:Uncharacterized protein n=1 Tax=Vanrija pseudolonga TaxID=143232 RepID=A0AAF0YGP7_9TREE|nr:hypothetical protein LOC62_06G008762 [Vanrija pseudolonga]
MANASSKEAALQRTTPDENSARSTRSTRMPRSSRYSTPNPANGSTSVVAAAPTPPITPLNQLLAGSMASGRASRRSSVAPAPGGSTAPPTRVPTNTSSSGGTNVPPTPLNAASSVRKSLAGPPPPPITRRVRQAATPQVEPEADPKSTPAPSYSSEFQRLRTAKLAFENDASVRGRGPGNGGYTSKSNSPGAPPNFAAMFAQTAASDAGASNAASSSRRVIGSPAPSSLIELDSEDEDEAEEYQDWDEDEEESVVVVEDEDEEEGETKDKEDDDNEGGSDHVDIEGKIKNKSKGKGKPPGYRTNKDRVHNGRPDEEEAKELFNELKSAKSVGKLTEYVNNHPFYRFDPHKVFDLIFPHPYLKNLVEGDFPFHRNGINFKWGQNFARLRQFATYVLKPSKPERLYTITSRLRKAVAMLGPERPADHKVSCKNCESRKIKISCIDVGPGACFDCGTRGNGRVTACQHYIDDKAGIAEAVAAGNGGAVAQPAKHESASQGASAGDAVPGSATDTAALKSVDEGNDASAVLSFLHLHMITEEKDAKRKTQAKFLLERLPSPEEAAAGVPVRKGKARMLFDHFLLRHLVNDEKDEERKEYAALLFQWLLELPDGTKHTTDEPDAASQSEAVVDKEKKGKEKENTQVPVSRVYKGKEKQVAQVPVGRVNKAKDKQPAGAAWGRENSAPGPSRHAFQVPPVRESKRKRTDFDDDFHHYLDSDEDEANDNGDHDGMDDSDSDYEQHPYGIRMDKKARGNPRRRK